MPRPGIHQSTPIDSGDVAISGGWGASAALVVFGGSSDIGGAVSVQASGAGLAAGPSITITFRDGAFPHTPIAVLSRGPDTGNQLDAGFYWTSTTTTLTIVFNATPVNGQIYAFSWMLCGGET
jgi:hypothetical protein